MNKYTFRLDVIPEVSNIEERVQTFLDRLESPKYLISFEIADITKKEHYQGIVYTDMKLDTYQHKVRRAFPEWKSTQRAASLVKKDEYEIYITKDGNYKFVKGYTQEELDALHAQSYHLNVDIKNKVLIEPCCASSITQKEQKKITWFLRLVRNCEKQNIKTSSEGWEIVAVILETYQEFVKCEPNDIQLRNYAKSIQRHMYYIKSQDENNPSIYKNYIKKRAQQVIGSEWIKD